MAIWRGRERVVDAEGVVGGWADRDDARAELDADGDIVGVAEAAFAEADGKGGLAGAAVADADEFCYIVPGKGRWFSDCGHEMDGLRVMGRAMRRVRPMDSFGSTGGGISGFWNSLTRFRRRRVLLQQLRLGSRDSVLFTSGPGCLKALLVSTRLSRGTWAGRRKEFVICTPLSGGRVYRPLFVSVVDSSC